MDTVIEWQHGTWHTGKKIFKVVIKGVDKPNRRIWPQGFHKHLDSFVTAHNMRFEKWMLDPENQEYVVSWQSSHISYSITVTANNHEATIPINDLHYVLADVGLSMEEFYNHAELQQRIVDKLMQDISASLIQTRYYET